MNYGAALRILGLDNSYTEEDLKKSYRNLMKKYHPDLHAKATEHEKLQLEQKTKQINEAYEILAKSIKHRSNDTKSNTNYETSLEKTKKDAINRLNIQLKNLKNFFNSDAFLYKDGEIQFIEEAIESIGFCLDELAIFNIMRDLRAKITANNLEMFEYFINNWQIDKTTQRILKSLYTKYQNDVRYTKSVIGVANLIEKLKKECIIQVKEYEKQLKEYEKQLHYQVSYKLDSYIIKYSNHELYGFINNKINENKINLENKIVNIYLDDSYEEAKDYFDNLINKIYKQFETDVLNTLIKIEANSKKISKLYKYDLSDLTYQKLFDAKIDCLYSNITNDSFELIYASIKKEIIDLFKKTQLEKMNINSIKNRLLQNYVISISQLDTIKDGETIKETTDLFQQIISFLTNIDNDNIDFTLVPQLNNINFSDLKSAQNDFENIIFNAVDDCDIYIKRKKSSINGNVIKVRNISDQVDYDYNIEKLNCSFSSSMTLREFKENYISLQQFLIKAKYIGRSAKTNQLISNVKGIVLYATNDNALFLDANQNKFKFVIIKDKINYYNEVEMLDNLKDKVTVYKMLLEQFDNIFEEEYEQPKVKRL